MSPEKLVQGYKREVARAERSHVPKSVTIQVLTCECGSQHWLMCSGGELRCAQCKAVIAGHYWTASNEIPQTRFAKGVVIDAEIEP